MEDRVKDQEDHEKTFREFWKPVVCNDDGTLNEDKVMRELHDYANFMDNVSKVYCHITNGKISKPNTLAEAVIAEADDSYAELERENEKDRNEGCSCETEQSGNS